MVNRPAQIVRLLVAVAKNQEIDIKRNRGISFY
ncbi:hypothetical protein EDF57_107205 [Novosphingobium sp. PhB55]|nr:hypothetical protein EDF57_107205 [Novosphingobium sp. PhB55]